MQRLPLLLLTLLQLLGASQSAEVVRCSFFMDEETVPGASVQGPNLYRDCFGFERHERDQLTLIQPKGFGPGWDVAKDLVALQPDGSLKVKKKADRDEPALHCPNQPVCEKVFEVKLENFDRAANQLGITQFRLEIRDINDNQPEFTPTDQVLEATENVVGQTLQLPAVTDRDAGQNGATETRIKEVSDAERRGADTLEQAGTGRPRLVVGPGLDYEKARGYNITLEACDGNKQRKCSTATVHIRVLDANDNAPQFSERNYELKPVPENAYKPGQRVSIGQLTATDADSGANSRLVYSIVPPGTDAMDIDPATGEIFLVGPVNAVDGSKIQFEVQVSDSGPRPMVDKARVSVQILDVNNNEPRIEMYNKYPLREAAVNQKIAILRVTDGDLLENSRVDCKLEEGADRFSMQLLQSSGDVKFFTLNSTRVYDRETQAQDSFVVACWDHGTPALTALKTFTIDIADVNEHEPKFNSNVFYNNRVKEQLADAFVAQVTATDKDATANLTYRIVDEGLARGHFSINPTTGMITTRAPLDRESEIFDGARPECVLTVEVSDGQRTDRAQVNVEVLDVNDNPPELAEPRILTVNESYGSIFSSHIPVGQLAYTDKDQPDTDNHRTWISLIRALRSPPNLTFHVDTDGEVSARGVLDREQCPEHLVVVSLRNVADRQSVMETTATVTVRLRDVNDNAPQVLRPRPGQQFNVTEDQPPGAVVTHVEVTDRDDCSPATAPLDCLRRGGMRLRLHQQVLLFSVNSSTGELRVVNALTTGVHRLNLTVTDHGAPWPHTSWVNFTVLVLPRSEHLFLGPGWGSGSNWTVLLVIVVASSFITIVLVVAIVLLNRRQPCLVGSASGVRRRGSGGKCRNGDRGPPDGEGCGSGTGGGGAGGSSGGVAAGGGGGFPPGVGDGSRRQLLTTFGHQMGGPGGDIQRREGGLNGYQMQFALMPQHPNLLPPGDYEVASADSGHGASEEEIHSDQRAAEHARFLTLPTCQVRAKSPACNCIMEEDYGGPPVQCHEHIPLSSRQQHQHQQQPSSTFGRYPTVQHQHQHQHYQYQHQLQLQEQPLTLLGEPRFNDISLSSQPSDYRSLSRPHGVSILSPIAGSRAATPQSFGNGVGGGGGGGGGGGDKSKSAAV